MAEIDGEQFEITKETKGLKATSVGLASSF